MSEQNTLEVRMFGGLSLRCGENCLDSAHSRSRRIWTLLAYLIVNRSRWVGQAELTAFLWANSDADDPRNALKTLLCRVRSLTAKLSLSVGRNVVLYSHGAYRWNPDITTTVDTEEFTKLIREAESAPREERIPLTLRALMLYRGEFLWSVPATGWAAALAARYREQYAMLVRELLSLFLLTGNPRSSLRSEPPKSSKPMQIRREAEALRSELSPTRDSAPYCEEAVFRSLCRLTVRREAHSGRQVCLALLAFPALAAENAGQLEAALHLSNCDAYTSRPYGRYLLLLPPTAPRQAEGLLQELVHKLQNELPRPLWEGMQYQLIALTAE